jgi:hypothetical protein
MATLIKVDGTETEVEGTGAKRKSGKRTIPWEQARDVLGGYIERLPVANRQVILLDEEGKLKGLPINRKATRLMFERYGADCGDVIVGDVLVTRGEGW